MGIAKTRLVAAGNPEIRIKMVIRTGCYQDGYIKRNK